MCPILEEYQVAKLFSMLSRLREAIDNSNYKDYVATRKRASHNKWNTDINISKHYDNNYFKDMYEPRM